MTPFKNRQEAGQRLAEKLAQTSWPENTLILALPRGGVPVAIEVAKALHRPWSLLLVKKIGSPLQPEYAMGALAEDEAPLWNKEALNLIDLNKETLDELVGLARKKIEAQKEIWRQAPLGPLIKEKTIIIVDDGLATGLTMKAALAFLRKQGASKIVIAVPVAPAEAVRSMKPLASSVIAIETPAYFSAVGEWYDDFTQVSDETVTALLKTQPQ